MFRKKKCYYVIYEQQTYFTRRNFHHKKICESFKKIISNKCAHNSCSVLEKLYNYNIFISCLYVGHLISLVNFHEMALQSIWWRDISKDPQPEKTHNSRLVIIWSRLSQSLQNTHWRRQWLSHLTRISSHRAKFLSLGTERSHTGPNFGE